MERKTKILNGCYEKISNIGQGSGGKVILCRVIQQIPLKNNLEFLLSNNENQNQNTNQKEEQKSKLTEKKFQKEFQVVKQFHNQSLAGLGKDTVNEIKLMKSLNHPNIMKINDIFMKEKHYTQQVLQQMCITMDYMIVLSEIFREQIYKLLSLNDKKCIIKQITEGIKYMHDHWVLHRDIKPENIYINEKGIVVIGDFGISRSFGSPDRKMSTKVVTRYFRPPEILFETQIYGKSIDIWSLGCTIAQILNNGEVLFAGSDDIEQLQKIFQKRGTPNQQNWEGCQILPAYLEFEHRDPMPLTEQFKGIDNKDAIDLLDKLLQLDPNKRISAEEILQHKFLQDTPQISLTILPTIGKQLIQEGISYLIKKQK